MVTNILRRSHGAVVLTLLLTLACDGDRAVPTDTRDATPPDAGPMAADARPNRTVRATGPLDRPFELSYQPDWVSRISMSSAVRGAPTTTTLFANPGYRERMPGPVIRTRIASPEHGLDFEVILNDPDHVVKRVIVETVATDGAGEEKEVVFTIEDTLPPPPGRGDTIPDAG